MTEEDPRVRMIKERRRADEINLVSREIRKDDYKTGPEEIPAPQRPD